MHRALAITLGDPQLAREATDEAMARSCAHWRRVGQLDNPGGWAYRVGLNWATSWWRKMRRETALGGADGADAFGTEVVSPTGPAATAALVALREFSTP